ncbi:hypothetical protein F183_A44930 [Bryobacterales bacterium F-183]|nr:hypothetical protein F183_A44930 [Bryobacterales bacterium F-183]
MRSRLAFLLLSISFLTAQRRDPPAPSYSADTIVNAASGVPDSYCPYGLLTIHGKDLALTSNAVDFPNVNTLPVALANTGTRVLVHNRPIGLLTVSPQEIVALLPPDLPVGVSTLQILVNALAGPAIPIVVRAATPALFLQAEGVAALTNNQTDENITMDNPAPPGSEVVLFATGLGAMRPSPVGFTLLKRTAPVVNPVDVELDGVPVPADAILYAGLQPGLAGQYQIKFRVPMGVSDFPTVRLHSAGMFSQEGIRLPIRTTPPPATEEVAPIAVRFAGR